MKQPSPTSLIIFGATGDLMGKKIVPSLWHLFKTEQLPQGFDVIGISRKDFSDAEFRDFVRNLAKTYIKDDMGSEEETFLSLFSFSRVAFESDTDFEVLAKQLDARDTLEGPRNRLIYMAVPPEAFPGIFGHPGFGTIVKHGEEHGAHTRVIIEKPFGTDLATARALEHLLSKRFSEEQLYRADHYLAKAMLLAIPHFRFAEGQGALESLWNRDHVEGITIRTWETLGLESRGPFYDALGTLRDVGQNHLLEMLALIAMEKPKDDAVETTRKARAKIIEKLEPMSEKDIAERTMHAQYAGYREIQGVDPESNTETYYRLTAHLDTPRWKGVPITMEAGKRLHETRTEIVLSFKEPKGEVVFRMRPKEEIVVSLAGLPSSVETLTEETRQQYVAEYSRLIMAAAEGNHLLFVGKDEIEAAWKFIDPIVASWEHGTPPLGSYTPDTDEAVR